MHHYQIPKGRYQTELEIKRSRFIAYLEHTQGSEHAKRFIAELKTLYPDARHHCYGFMGGNPKDSNQYGFSDDGEPSGTAGMPIFSHLQHNNIGEVCIVVVRYFGGTKLGTGGLARAYGDAAKAVLEISEFKTFINTKTINIALEFALEAEVRKRIEAVKGQVLDVAYSDKVKIQAQIPTDQELILPYSVDWLSKSTI